MTLQQIGDRHGVSIVRAKQLVDEALLKLKKTLSEENTI
jgi:DNA-directed RNA polymerase specialized sigma subunit